MELYEAELLKALGPAPDLESLEGLRLVCHCTPSQLCHVDVLIRLFEKRRAELLGALAAPPASDTDALAQASSRRAGLLVPRMGKATLARQTPTLQAGLGAPIMVGRGDTRRLLADGAGLCSPGLWPPHRRHPPTGIAHELFRTLSEELDLLASSTAGGLDKFLADIASGRVASDPFPADATERLRS